MPLIELRNVAKAYGGTPALVGADLVVAPGEIHALMGENGAGKSTLIKILAGVVAPDTATIRMDDQLVAIDSPRAAHRLGLRFIHQELNIVPTLSVAENILIGRPYPRRLGLFVDWPRLHAIAREALKTLGITHIDTRARLATLPLGDQMLVRISSAFLSDPDAPARLYVMDEPTAALTREESERLFAVLHEIRRSGNSVLYVSHRLDEVMALCDRATVLRDGRSIDSGELKNITHDDLVAMMIGRKVTEAYPPALAAPRPEVALKLTGFSGPGIRPLTLELRAGEILGLAGLSGMGQSELLRLLVGDSAARGQMQLGGRPFRPHTPGAAWRGGIAYVPRERRSEGLVTSRPIFENITLPGLARNSLFRTLLTPGREKARATELGATVRLKAKSVAQRVRELSGGNQQKVVFAKALDGTPQLLLLDEPTRGVDIGAKFDIYQVIREMTARGMAVILVSSDLPELLGMADRIAIIRSGEVTDIVPGAGLTEQALLNLCYGRAAAKAA